MALNTFKCNYLTLLHFKGLTDINFSDNSDLLNVSSFVYLTCFILYFTDYFASMSLYFCTHLLLYCTPTTRNC